MGWGGIICDCMEMDELGWDWMGGGGWNGMESDGIEWHKMRWDAIG